MAPLFKDGITARDVAYNNIRDHGDVAWLLAARNFTESLWVRYEQHADEHFLTEIQNDFHARFWEMYLACSLEEVGYAITCPKPGPDILLTIGATRVWIEAVSPSGGQAGSPDRVPDYRSGGAYDVPQKEILLRIRSAIHEKFDKYLAYRQKGIIGPDDAYLVAVNASKINYARSEGATPWIVQAVYPVGHPQITLNRETKEIVGSSYTYRPELQKVKGGAVSTDIFFQEEYRPLSAVLYSCIDPANRPERLGDDYVIVHNLNASTGITHGLVGRGREYSASEREDAFSLTPHYWGESKGTEPKAYSI